MIDILLSTYNGARFLSELLDSILAQSITDFRILVRDDGSSDATLDILQEYRQRHPDKIQILLDGLGNLKPLKSFNVLLGVSEADYVAFADQDDRWHPDKLKRLLTTMMAEEDNSPDTPILVHSDLVVTDGKLSLISPSMWHHQGLRPAMTSLNRLMVQNNVTGCAAMINRKLREMSGAIPPEAIMHDWWLALVAAAFGQVVPIAESLIDYRQHGRNEVGAKHYSVGYIGRIAAGMLMRDRLVAIRASVKLTQQQAGAFLTRYHPLLSTTQRQLLGGYASLGDMGWWQRRGFVLRHHTLKQGLSRNIGLLLTI